jgi:beta-D-galactosyl-(1->4)-L-rhamnose phosphorylase
MQLDPYCPNARAYLKGWLASWCEDNPQTDVVRFTSMFYNFVWIWGSDSRRRNVFTDWASYDFTVSTLALDDFEKEYGYALCAEDFVRQGKYNATHRVPDKKKRDWMEFIGRFVRKAGRELVDIVHGAGKKAYVFYDDNWVGIEPYSGHFEEFNFDGLIKCVFSGYEVRLCADVPVETHEIRFHPYLFPVGLGGTPTFSEGGTPGKDALNYWVNTRRALLRKKIERCGIGGYLSLTEGYPCFIEAMDRILDEFRFISSLHDRGKPEKLKPRVAILHTWGKLRTWTLSGHFHETDSHVLIHILESLSGLPFDVEFISFEDLSKIPENIDVIINAGQAGDAWSGGVHWDDERIVENLTAWVHSGGVFLGVGEPSALKGRNKYLRMSHVLGVDIDCGEYACHGKWSFEIEHIPGLIPPNTVIPTRNDVVITDEKTLVLFGENENPALTALKFGNGIGLYCTGLEHNSVAPRFLQNLILYATMGSMNAEGVSDNAMVECTVFADSSMIVFANNSDAPQAASCTINGERYSAKLEPYGITALELSDSE